jgi:hypothetical protein
MTLSIVSTLLAVISNQVVETEQCVKIWEFIDSSNSLKVLIMHKLNKIIKAK